MEEWFNSVPKITRTWFVLALGTTIFTEVGSINPYSLIFLPENILYKFEVWRLFTPFIFFGGFGFPFAMQLYFLIKYSGDVEANPFSTTQGAFVGGTVDYAFCLLIMGVTMMVIGYFASMAVLGSPLVFSVLYLWSRKNENQVMNFWGFK